MVSWHTVIVQELCESRGGRPGLSVLTSLLVFRGRKALLNHASALVSAKLQALVYDILPPWRKVPENDARIVGLSLSLICQLTSEDIKQHYLPTWLVGITA